MKPQLQIHIPKPCHEDWNKMPPVDKGKFCGSCNKQVVDFSLMSDQQVLNYFSTTTGKTCGRFAEDQLQRELIPIKIEKKKTWWFAALMPLLLFFDKATAQKKNVTTLGTPAVIKKDPIQQIMGKVAAPVLNDSAIVAGEIGIKRDSIKLVGFTVAMPKDQLIPTERIIKGKITDRENNETIPFATIAIKGEKTITISDSEGNFELHTFPNEKSITLIVSSVGFEQKEINISVDNNLNNVTLQREENSLPEVIVVNQELTSCSRMLSGDVVITAGYSIVHQPVKKFDTLFKSIRKVFRNAAFTAYPNPALKGSTLHIEIKKTGKYSIQLLDNSSKLISVDEFIAASNHAVTSVEIPSTLASGIYYLRVIDERSKKSYVDKIVVQ